MRNSLALPAAMRPSVHGISHSGLVISPGFIEEVVPNDGWVVLVRHTSECVDTCSDGVDVSLK